MNENYLHINGERERAKIVSFLKRTFAEQQIKQAVIGLSEGIDSTTSFFLLREVLPASAIHVAHLYYFKPVFEEIEKEVLASGIPEENIHVLSIREAVDSVVKLQGIGSDTEGKVRLGNIAARMRMIVLFDLAKHYHGLVVGTENKTENLLSYFTRFGDQASDIEPIAHLYKTQVLQLARHLGVPEGLVKQKPTAGLWQGQTDEGEFGFPYEEADQVLFLALEKQQSIAEIESKGFKNAKKILAWRERNLFKHRVPYVVGER